MLRIEWMLYENTLSYNLLKGWIFFKVCVAAESHWASVTAGYVQKCSNSRRYYVHREICRKNTAVTRRQKFDAIPALSTYYVIKIKINIGAVIAPAVFPTPLAWHAFFSPDTTQTFLFCSRPVSCTAEAITRWSALSKWVQSESLCEKRYCTTKTIHLNELFNTTNGNI